MGECLVKNMIDKANFSNFFLIQVKMMLKLGRKIQWVKSCESKVDRESCCMRIPTAH